jgi:hypothetical protein
MRRHEELSNFQLEHARQQYDQMDNAVEQLTRNVLLKAHAQSMSRTCERRMSILLQRQKRIEESQY